jgi:ketosteroid isomerase-like protein
MTTENVEAVRDAATAFASGDLDRAAEVLAPEVELIPPAEDPDVKDVYRGAEGAREWLDNWLEAWEDFEFRLDDVIDAGDRVVVIFSQRGRGKTSGVEISNQLAAVATLSGGKVVRGALYLDIDEALGIAGVKRPAAPGD